MIIGILKKPNKNNIGTDEIFEALNGKIIKIPKKKITKRFDQGNFILASL